MGVKAGSLKSDYDYKLCILVARGIFLSSVFPKFDIFKGRLCLILKGNHSECLSTDVTLIQIGYEKK